MQIDAWDGYKEVQQQIDECKEVCAIIDDELNRTAKLDDKGRERYYYTDPAYDELLATKEALRHIRRIAQQGDVNIQPLLLPILDLVRTVLP